MRSLIVIFLALLFLEGCTTAPKNFSYEPPENGKSKIYIYRPHVWEVMWGEYVVSLKNKPIKILKDSGFFSVEVDPGNYEIQSSHISEKEVVTITLNLEANKSYFLKLDPDAEKFTVMGAVGDVLAISTLVAGARSQMRIEGGQGNLSDVRKMVNGEAAKENLKPKKSLGHHLLLQIKDDVAQKEMAMCCSSLKVRTIEMK